MATESEAKAILAEYADKLASLPNVVGVGVVSDEAARAQDAVAVYVSVKRPQSQLRPADIVPRTLSSVIGGKTIEAPTRVIEVGEIKF
jgi:hypothetical protein